MAFDCFLKLEGIPGESTDSKHKDEIEVLSFSLEPQASHRRGVAAGRSRQDAALRLPASSSTSTRPRPSSCWPSARGGISRRACSPSRNRGAEGPPESFKNGKALT